TGSTIAFTVPAGTYTYRVGSISGYTASPGSASLSVTGNVSVQLTFTRVNYLTMAAIAVGIASAALIAGVLVLTRRKPKRRSTPTQVRP
ncbi:MAG: hypothetical protein ACP5UU_05795, partial [Thermoprotei archaeon]